MRAILSILLICFVFVVKANVPVLERSITINFANESVVIALERIEKQTGCVFSYQSNILKGGVATNQEFKEKTIREVLSAILPKTVLFKSKGNYIIIKERPKTAKAEMSGYVYEANSNKKLANVTIYDKNTLQSVTTNEYGFYSIYLPTNNQCLTVNKLNYEDTCIALMQTNENGLVNIALAPVKDSTASDSVEWLRKLRDLSDKTNDLFRKFRGYVNTLNVKDTIDQNFQFSFMPFIGTNGRMSGSVYNRYSINLIGGYSRGNRLLELGGMFNINKENMRGGQFAGMFNVVGDSVNGLQVAGFLNITGRSVHGLQGAGFMNLNFGTMKGAQGAGFMNINDGNVYGITGAGFMNICGDTLRGITGAGFMNITEFSKRSVEVAGFLNATEKADNNIQLAGFMNLTEKGSTRLQVSGFLNMARKITGAQIGLINFCDSSTGVPIGLISIVKHGLHQLEISADETFYTNASLRLGVHKFYNVLSYGIQPSGESFWHVGYGIGTSFKLAEKWRCDLTLIDQHVSSGGFYLATSDLYKLYVGAEFKLAKKLSVAFGPTFNLFITDAITPQYAGVYSNLAPYTHFEHTTRNDFNLKGWVGGKIAVRFF